MKNPFILNWKLINRIFHFLNVRPYCSDHPLSALSHANMSVVSSFHAGGVGDAFSDCAIGEHTR